MGILLHIVALIIILTIAPIGVIYSMIRLWAKANFKTWLKRVNEYFKFIAVSIDILGNVLMQDLLDDVLITKNGYKFGENDKTISYVLGMNEKSDTLRCVGKALVALLNWLEKDHCLNATRRKR
jgi:hypothetical protein